MDFPAFAMPAPPLISPFSIEAGGLPIRTATGNSSLTGTSSTAWPTANKAFFYPFTLTDFATVLAFAWYVGATSNGNVDIGVYDQEANLVLSTGSTAMSASTDTVQTIDVADTLLAPGGYVLAAACDSGTGTVFLRAATDESALACYPVYEQASAFPLPAAATPVLCTASTVPLLCVAALMRSVF